jgi:hypothetical protein
MSLVKFEKKKKRLQFLASAFHYWWAHQDLNLGPKDYEQLQETISDSAIHHQLLQARLALSLNSDQSRSGFP